MKLEELVEKAYNEDKHFKEKYRYWVQYRRKKPDLEWLMPLLQKALGREFVENAAKEEIQRQRGE